MFEFFRWLIINWMKPVSACISILIVLSGIWIWNEFLQPKQHLHERYSEWQLDIPFNQTHKIVMGHCYYQGWECILVRGIYHPMWAVVVDQFKIGHIIGADDEKGRIPYLPIMRCMKLVSPELETSECDSFLNYDRLFSTYPNMNLILRCGDWFGNIEQCSWNYFWIMRLFGYNTNLTEFIQTPDQVYSLLDFMKWVETEKA
jgi:hypothetical protein